MTKGKRIRTLRNEMGITQEEMAKALHTTKQTISKYENDIVTNIPSDKIEEMCRLLKTTPEYILAWPQTEIEKNNDLITKVVVKMRSNKNFSNAVASLLEEFNKVKSGQ